MPRTNVHGLALSDAKIETFSMLIRARDVITTVGVLKWLRASPPLSNLSAIALGKYGADQAKSSLTPHIMRSNNLTAISDGLCPSALESWMWSCRSDSISARRWLRSASGATDVYNHVHALTSDLTTGMANAKTINRIKGISNDISKVVVSMNLPTLPLRALLRGTYLRVMPCQR